MYFLQYKNFNVMYPARNVLPIHPGCLLSLCVFAGLLDLRTLCPQRTLYSWSLSGCGMGEVCRIVSQLHIPRCGEISFKLHQFLKIYFLLCKFSILLFFLCSNFLFTSKFFFFRKCVKFQTNSLYIKNICWNGTNQS